MQQMSVDARIAGVRTAKRFPANLIGGRQRSRVVRNSPRTTSRIQVRITELLERSRWVVLVLFIIVPDYIHERPRIVVVEHHLAGARALQGLLVEFFDG